MAAAVAVSQQIGAQIWSSKFTTRGRSQGSLAVAGINLKRRLRCVPLFETTFARRNVHPAHQRLDLGCSALSSISGSQTFSSSQQVLRYLAARPAVTEETSVGALLIRAGLLDIIKRFLSGIWNTIVKAPVLAFARFFQKEVDDATDIVKGGAQVVLRIAHTVDDLSDIVESYAENVAEIAEKVIETTDKVDEELEDVVQVLKDADDIDELAAGISEETGISIASLTNLKEKSQAVQAKSTELKSASTQLKEASKAALDEKEKS